MSLYRGFAVSYSPNTVGEANLHINVSQKLQLLWYSFNVKHSYWYSDAEIAVDKFAIHSINHSNNNNNRKNIPTGILMLSLQYISLLYVQCKT